jgi:hypothetical protein
MSIPSYDENIIRLVLIRSSYKDHIDHFSKSNMKMSQVLSIDLFVRNESTSYIMKFDVTNTSINIDLLVEAFTCNVTNSSSNNKLFIKNKKIDKCLTDFSAYYRYDSFNSYKCKGIFILQYSSHFEYKKKPDFFLSMSQVKAI